VLPVQRFHWDSAEYAEAFATLMRCCGDRVYARQLLRKLFAAYPAESHAVDWWTGGGDLTSVLLEHFHHVYAVERPCGHARGTGDDCRFKILDWRNQEQKSLLLRFCPSALCGLRSGMGAAANESPSNRIPGCRG
jgi:hypothetical protein